MPKRVSPQEAKGLIDQGWVYVDVRTPEEYAAGHPEGAYNVPIGPELVGAIESLFPARDAKIVVGCQAGGRSLRALGLLEAAGYTNVVDQRAGWGGNGSEAGWGASGLPSETTAQPGRSWREIAAKRG
ncbi:rhodanese-like domain-containing protein [Sandaracinus amylolyticus]|uniref:Rhodanese domain protein n=1 Tax=Sandaracinus amylolyticus TaxID=927083 RepID=A0A0F6SHT8_9BACT|nr:rhodanese-like domain-containing protein [Sandaracinus amylolyticus]AKF11019.1 Rhodanese domain protein [Sandaracinus amylolyticus]